MHINIKKKKKTFAEQSLPRFMLEIHPSYAQDILGVPAQEVLTYRLLKLFLITCKSLNTAKYLKGI